MWTLLLLHAAAAEARPLPKVVVRPLPAIEHKPLPVGWSKADLIASAWVQYTVDYTSLGTWFAEDGELVADPAGFHCEVRGSELLVSYVREGFETKGLPRKGSCSAGEHVVEFRIKVDRKG